MSSKMRGLALDNPCKVGWSADLLDCLFCYLLALNQASVMSDGCWETFCCSLLDLPCLDTHAWSSLEVGFLSFRAKLSKFSFSKCVVDPIMLFMVCLGL